MLEAGGPLEQSRGGGLGLAARALRLIRLLDSELCPEQRRSLRLVGLVVVAIPVCMTAVAQGLLHYRPDAADVAATVLVDSACLRLGLNQLGADIRQHFLGVVLGVLRMGEPHWP